MPTKLRLIEAQPVRIRRDRTLAEGTAGTPTSLTGSTGDYRWSEAVGCLYSIHFETALVRVFTDDGLEGIGEAQAPLAPEVACEIVRLLLRPALEGEDFDGTPACIEHLYDRMYRTMRVRGQTGGFLLDAMAGVDIALWDLAGKMQNTPVAALLSPQPPARVPAYWSGLSGDAATAVNEIRQQGFTTVKIFHDSTPEALLAKVDAAQAAGLQVAVDALWRLDLTTAQALAPELDRRQLLWLEAPLPPENVKAHAALAHSIDTPIAIGESYRTTWELAPFLEAGIKIIQPDLGRCGITGFHRICHAARAAGAEVIPHVSVALSPQIAAAIHAAAAYDCRLLEYNPNVFTVANQHCRPPLQLSNAHYEVPTAPGLGLTGC